MNVMKLKEILVGSVDGKIVKQKSKTDNITYNDLESNSSIRESVAENVNNFHELFVKLSDELDFREYTGMTIQSFEVYKEMRKKDVEDFILQGMERDKGEIQDLSSTMEETLFFYPIIGLMPKLAFEISQKV